MNILYYWLDYQTNMENWQRIHFFDELERSGVTIEVFNPLHFSSIDEANSLLKARITQSNDRPDLFMTCVDSKYLYEDSIKVFSMVGIPTLLICFDNLHDPYMHKCIAHLFDLVWLTSFETEYIFKKWNCNTIFLPYAANPYRYSPRYNNTFHAVGFIGTLYGARLAKIQLLASNEIKCDVYTNTITNKKNEKKVHSNSVQAFINMLRFSIGRRVLSAAIKDRFLRVKQFSLHPGINFYPSVSFDKMVSLYSDYSLSLGVTELRNTYLLDNPIHKLHLRSFEIPMSGGLQFTSYNEELSNYFESDKEIIFYSTSLEMISKSKFYTNKRNSTTVQALKRNAYLRAVKDHTWSNRFKKVFDKLGLKENFISYSIKL
jgi:spore maturation protein CgeB